MLKKSLWLVLVIPALVNADATLKYHSTGSDGDLDTTMYVTPEHLRMETTGAEKPVVMLYDAATDEAILLDPEKKQYVKMGQVMKQAQAASSMIQSMMKDVPPEQRAMMSKMMGKLGGMMKQPEAKPAATDAVFHKTGKTDSANGVSCEWVENPAGKSEFCLAGYDDLGLAAGDAETMKEFMKKGREMASAARNMLGGMIRTGQMFDGSIDGVPVIMQQASGRNMKLVSKKSGAAPAGGFGIPAGYSAMKMPDIIRH